jgi:hypothetical protein
LALAGWQGLGGTARAEGPAEKLVRRT